MNFIVNINGTSNERFEEQARALNAACKQLGQALRDAYPHGRDYQTHPDAENARTLDLVQFNRAFQKLAEIEALAQRYTNRIAKQ